LEQVPLAGFWMKVADLVVRYPVRILALCVIALTPLAVIEARTKPNYSQLADLNPDQDSVGGAKAAQRYFAVGELRPTTLLIHHPNIDFRSETGRKKVGDLTRQLVQVRSVAEVRSIAQPLGKPPVPDSEKSTIERYMDRAIKPAVDARYVSMNPISK